MAISAWLFSPDFVVIQGNGDGRGERMEDLFPFLWLKKNNKTSRIDA